MAEMSGGWLGDPTFVRRLWPVAVFGAVLILADQAGQMAASLPGFEPGYPVWRFQAATLLVSRFTGFGLAILLFLAAAVWTGSRWIGRVAGAVLALLVVGLLAALAILWVDGPTVKEQVPAGRLIEFILQWVRVLAMAGLGVGSVLALLVASGRHRASRGPGSSR